MPPFVPAEAGFGSSVPSAAPAGTVGGPDDPQPIVLPAYPQGPLSPRDIILGRPLEPRQVITTYSPDEYEQLVKEWAQDGLGTQYAVVRRASGAGDMGRDVLGFVGAAVDTSPYDNYQCKHYRAPLAPSDVWVELGKVCWYTYRNEYRVPRFYYFVAPHGVGPKLQRYLEEPDRFRGDFLAQWDAHCKDGITSGTSIALDGALRAYVEAFDFHIFRAVDPDDLIAQHAQTRWHATRFGGGLRKARIAVDAVPGEVRPHEARYVRHLLAAYGSHLGTPVERPDALAPHDRLARHFGRQRVAFYRAASLRQFERDTMPHDAGFIALMDEIHDGVVDVCEDEHADGFARVKAVAQAAQALHPSSYALVDHLRTDDKVGICHHLANDDRLCWCPDAGA